MSAPSWATPNTSRSPSAISVPIVITGFEPIDMLEGVLAHRPSNSRAGRAEVENQYSRAVRREGNPAFAEVDRRRVRGLRSQMARRRLIPKAAIGCAPEYRDHDAERIFEVERSADAGIERVHQRARSCKG